MKRYEFGLHIAETTGISREHMALIRPVMELITQNAEDKLTDLEAAQLKSADSLEQVKSLVQSVDVEVEIGTLAVTLLLTLQSSRIFADRGIPEQVFLDTMKNIRIANEEYAKEHEGKPGMTRYGFVRCNLWGDVLRHGRLEYEIEPFGHDEYEAHGFTVKPDDPVVKIHIPSDGPMLPDDVEKSFCQAYRYYRMGDITPFICGSWLNYPGNRKFCKPDANIIRFMECFHLLHWEDRPRSNDLRRIFGKDADYENLAALPEETSLQKRLKAHLLNGGTMGWGYGIFLHDGSKRL